MGEKFYTEMKTLKRILIVTNDSTVFKDKNRLLSAFEMFDGRATEVKRLVARLDTAVNSKGSKLCDVSYGVITTHYGFVPGNYMITGYDKVMENKEDYIAAEKEKEYVEQVSYLTRPFDKTVMCVPKEMFRLFLDADYIEHGKIIAVTNPEFREECEKRDWVYLERNGARVGNDNADAIERLVRELCEQ